MTVFAKLVFIASAIILAHFLLSLRRRSLPELFCHGLSYDPNANKIRLRVENYGTKPLYVKPAFRLVHLKSAEEWKNGVAEDGIPMMSAREMSLIKGYELLNEIDEAVEVPAKNTQDIEVDLGDNYALRAYDNVRVSMLCGMNPIQFTDALHSTLRVKLDEASQPEISLDLPEVDVTQEIDAPKKPSMRKRVVKNGFPLEATCVCCGQVKWLKWVVDSQHVCVECREFLYEKIRGEYPEEEIELDLSARQKKIMELIEGEGEVTVRHLSNLLDKSRTTAAKELKTLLKVGAIERRKEKNKHVYALA